MDDDTRKLHHKRIVLLSGMVQSLRAALAQAEQATDAERAARRNAEAELALLRAVYDDLLRLVREREAGR